MKTLNEIKSTLINYFKSHAMIKSVFYLNDFDFNAERNISYKTVNIEFTNANINNNVLFYLFQITIADSVIVEDTVNEDNVISDCIQIAEDFFTFLDNFEGSSFNKISSIDPFTDDTSDRVAGIVFNVSIATIRRQNHCIKIED